MVFRSLNNHQSQGQILRDARWIWPIEKLEIKSNRAKPIMGLELDKPILLNKNILQSNFFGWWRHDYITMTS